MSGKWLTVPSQNHQMMLQQPGGIVPLARTLRTSSSVSASQLVNTLSALSADCSKLGSCIDDNGTRLCDMEGRGKPCRRIWLSPAGCASRRGCVVATLCAKLDVSAKCCAHSKGQQSAAVSVACGRQQQAVLKSLLPDGCCQQAVASRLTPTATTAPLLSWHPLRRTGQVAPRKRATNAASRHLLQGRSSLFCFYRHLLSCTNW